MESATIDHRWNRQQVQKERSVDSEKRYDYVGMEVTMCATCEDQDDEEVSESTQTTYRITY